MGISSSDLRNDIVNATTYPRIELLPDRTCRKPKLEEGISPTQQAIQTSYYEFLKTFTQLAVVQGSDIIDLVNEVLTPSGLKDKSSVLENFRGKSLWHNETNPVPLPIQAEMAADLFIGTAIHQVLESKKKFQDDADLVVELGAEINRHLSILHFLKKPEYDNVSKQIYDYFVESPEKFEMLSIKLKKKLEALGINPMIGDIRIDYEEKTKKLSWCFFEEGVIGSFTKKYNPSGDHSVCAICGIDGSGKSTLLNKLGLVVLPIAHPDDDRMRKFLTSFGEGIIDYDKELATFHDLRTGVLKRDLAITAFRFVRNLLAHLDKKFYPLTIFQNVILDRSSLTNIAYAPSPVKFGEAVSEVVMNNFLNPRKIIVIDTPVSIAYYRATQSRGDNADEFDLAEFSAYITRATMYRILGRVLPNVELFTTYDGEQEEISTPEVLVRQLKTILGLSPVTVTA